MGVTTINYNFLTSTEATANFDFIGPAGTGLLKKGGRWNWSNTTTDSNGTGPTSGYNAGYVYTETSSPTKGGDIFSMITKDTYDLTHSNMRINFKYNVNVSTPTPISIHIWDGFKWDNVYTMTPSIVQLNNTWRQFELYVDDYFNNDVKIKINITTPNDGSVTYMHDVGIDNVVIVLEEDTDSIVDFFKQYNIIKYRHFDKVFDGLTVTPTALETIINLFLTGIDLHTFEKYPDGVIVAGDNMAYLLRKGVSTYIKVSTNLFTINDAENKLGWVGSNIIVDKDVSYNKRSSISSSTDIENSLQYYELPVNMDLSNKTLRLWSLVKEFTHIVNGGYIRLYLSDGINDAYWDLFNPDVIYKGGWINAIVSTGILPLAGNVDMANIKKIGIKVTYSLSFISNDNNLWMDYVRYGDDITIVGVGTSFKEMYNISSSKGIGFGILTNEYIEFGVYGNIIIGGSIPTSFTESGSIIIFKKIHNNNNVYSLSLSGGVGINSDFAFNNCLITSEDVGYEILFNSIYITNLIIGYSTIANASYLSFFNSPLNAYIHDTAFINCSNIHVNSARFIDNKIININNSIMPIVVIDNESDLRYSKNIKVYNTSQAVVLYVDASVTAITLDNFTFNNPDGTNNIRAIYWDSPIGTLTINAINGTNITIDGINTAGGTINLIKTVATPETNTDLNTLTSMLESMASDIRTIKVTQGVNVTETETLIISTNGVRLVL